MQRIPDEEWDKIWGQFRLQLNGALGCFNMYGFQELIPGCADEIVALAQLADERVRGAEKPITLEYARHRVRKKNAKRTGKRKS